MFAIFTMFTILGFADTNYVYYSVQNGKPQFLATSYYYEVARDIVKIGDVALNGIDWSRVRVGWFTNDIPVPFTNISQVSITQLCPLTDEQKAAKDVADLISLNNRYQLENQFFSFCHMALVLADDPRSADSPPPKLAMDDFSYLQSMVGTNLDLQAQVSQLSIALIANNMALMRYDVGWWDTAIYHTNIVMSVSTKNPFKRRTK